MFSGGGIVDKQDTAGLGKGTLFVAFTSTGRGECLAYSRELPGQLDDACLTLPKIGNGERNDASPLRRHPGVGRSPGLESPHLV